MNIQMPQLGETVTEGTISKWHKKVGETVKSGEILFEIETDKTSMEIPATADGKLSQILVAEGNTSSCLLYTSPSPRDRQKSRMPSSA